MKGLKAAVLTIGGILLLGAGNAQAGPIGEVQWNGAEFTIEYVGLADTTLDLYDFALTANFTDYDGTGHTDYLIGVDYKPEGDLVGIDGVPTPVANWTYAVDANLNSGNGAECASGPGNNGFFCGSTSSYMLYPTAPTLSVPIPIYTWNFTLAISGVSDPDSLVDGAPLRALFTSGESHTTGQGEKLYTSLMSETTSVPEPSSLLLLSTGIVALSVGSRRRRRRR